MRRPLATILFFIFASVNRASLHGFAEDSEGSGYDLEGSGSWDWSDHGDINNIEDHLKGKTTAAKAGSGNQNTLHDPSDRAFNYLDWLVKNSGSESIVVRKSKGLLENKELFAAVVAGGTVGVILAAMLAVLLIYRWQEKDRGYALGRRRDSRDYH